MEFKNKSQPVTVYRVILDWVMRNAEVPAGFIQFSIGRIDSWCAFRTSPTAIRIVLTTGTFYDYGARHPNVRDR